jgi:Protein of unknown function (DUF1569)
MRRLLQYQSHAEVIRDVERLRSGYTMAGQWTLAQVCWHLERATGLRMSPPPHPESTPEQLARRSSFEQILATGQLPDGITAPEALQPPAIAGDADIDACIATLRAFECFPGPIAPHRLFGALTLGEGRKINLIHCARHLSFLTPTT